MEITAKLNYLRIAPRKVRLVADAVRGLTVMDAEYQLSFLTKRVSLPLLKLLRSAAANAKHNFSIRKEDLKIAKIFVDGGPVLKRSMPRAFGRASPIRKRSSHITLILAETQPTASVKKRPSGLRKEQLVHRVIGAEELKQASPEGVKGIKPQFKEAKKVEPRSRAAGVVRRIFQRKAI